MKTSQHNKETRVMGDESHFVQVMGLSGGTNTFELSGDVRDPTAVVMARIRKAQFVPRSAELAQCLSNVFEK